MKCNHPKLISPTIKFFVWLQILLQILFPLTLTFNPVVSLAAPLNVAQPVSVYTLNEGETVLSVADKYHTTVQALRELNQFRTFARGFDNLRAGDELDVPRLSPWQKRDEPQRSSSQAEKNVAGLASSLASQHPGDALTSLASNFASSEANKQIRQWLEQVGKAQVRLDLNKDSGLQNSQFDMLVPLADREQHLLFSQYSLHRTDDRTQNNLGFGYRRFHDNWMLGGNTFFDYDLSRGHMRMGAGVEYWRNYMTLGANGYLRLSNWKNSPDLEDYQERPANGWDVRAQAWLPVLPQLGGELMYEQYYGKQVALFGKEHRQRDPHAITLGVNYTPFPLLTLNAARRQGASGDSDTRIGAQLRYQPGEPLRKQLSSDAVQQLRTLAANRYGLVERNNNIVLDYRKKIVIRLQTTELITGYAGEEKSLNVAINSKYSLDKINWSAAALIAAGGKIVQKGAADYSVILPDYRYGPGSINTYSISGIAVDSKGNTSPEATTQVTVTQGAPNTAMSTFTPTRSLIPANGKTQQQLVLKVKDNRGYPVDIAVSDIKVKKEAKVRGNITSSLSAFTRQAAGEYVATLTAGTRPENFTITPFLHDSRFASANIVLTGDSASAQIVSGSLVVEKNNAKSNGTDANSVKATVKDATGNLLNGQVVKFTADNGAHIAATGTTNTQGEVVAELTNTRAGQSTIVATLNGTTEQQTVVFVADNSTAQIVNGALIVVKDKAIANGIDTNSVKATVTDAHGNAIVGQTVNFSADHGATIATTGTTDNDGNVTVTLTSTNAGLSNVTASINGSSQSQPLTFIADSSTAQIISGNLAVTKDNAKANDIDTNIVKATVTDAHGNRVPAATVSFVADNNGKMAATGTTDAQGEVTMTITSTKAGQSTVTATVNNSSQSQAVTFIADNSTAQIVSGDLVVISDNAKANGNDTNSVKATVTDAHGNLVGGQAVTFSADNGATITGSGTTGNDGSVTMALTNTKAGQTSVTASVNSSTQRQTVNFIADSSTAQIASGNLVVVRNNALADGTDQNSVKTTVTDAHGNILIDQVVNFAANNGVTIVTSDKTGSDGSVTVPLTSTKAGQSTVTASINGSSQSQTLTFVANGSTAQIASGNLTVINDNATANGQAANRIKATVTDAYGNVLENYSVSFAADNGAQIAASATTGSDGSVTMPLTSTKAGQSKVSVTVNGGTRSSTVTFVADSATAQITSGNMVIVSDNALANGSAANRVKVTVNDANGNLLSNLPVSFSADNGASIAAIANTGNDGSITLPLTSTKAGQSKVTASINGSSQSQTLTFIADSSTAQIVSGELVAVDDNAVANGIATNRVKATVKDAHGNTLAGETVNFSVDNGATITASGTTSPTGEVFTTLTSLKSGKARVSASINGSSENVTLTFIADSTTAQIINGALVVINNNAKANGSDTNSVKATVTDANGNLVTGLAVNFTADNGATIARSGTTGSDGSITMPVTSIIAGQSTVTASINGSSQSLPITFVADSATAQIVSGSLVVINDNALANGRATNSVKATVADAKGNLLTGLAVSFSADNSATIAGSGTTDASGEVVMTLTSTKAGQSKVTASINGSSQNQALTFIADSSTAQVTALTIVTNNVPANGSATNSVKASIADAYGNTLAGETVNFTADNGASITGSGRTDANGDVTVTLTSTTKGQSNVVATVNGSSRSVSVTFLPIIVRATVTELSNQALSDGIEMDKYTIRLMDDENKPVAGITPKVTLVSGKDLALGAIPPTDSNGESTFTARASLHGDRLVQVDIPHYPSETQQVSMSFDNPPYTLTWANVGLNFAIPIEWRLAVHPAQLRYTTSLRAKNIRISYSQGQAITCPVGTEKANSSVNAPDKKVVLTRLETWSSNWKSSTSEDTVAFDATGSNGELYDEHVINSGAVPGTARFQDHGGTEKGQSTISMQFEDGSTVNGGNSIKAHFDIHSAALTDTVAGVMGLPYLETTINYDIASPRVVFLGSGSQFTLTGEMVGSVMLNTFSIDYGKGDPGPCY